VAGRANCALVAGKSPLNHLELSRAEATRYHKIGHDPAAPLRTCSLRFFWRRTRPRRQ